MRWRWNTPRCTVCGKLVPLGSPHTVRDSITGNVIARFCSPACMAERARQNDHLDYVDAS